MDYKQTLIDLKNKMQSTGLSTEEYAMYMATLVHLHQTDRIDWCVEEEDLYNTYLGNVELVSILPASQFITGSKLATLVGLRAGVLVNDSADWAIVKKDDVNYAFPLKPIRTKVSWDELEAKNLVGKTNQLLNIRNEEWEITLFEGCDPNIDTETLGDLWPWGMSAEYNGKLTWSSQWNSLIYPLHSGKHTDTNNNCNGSYSFGELAMLTDEELSVGELGVSSWCNKPNNSKDPIIRGLKGVSHIARGYSYSKRVDIGWRPLLVSTQKLI